MQEKKPVLEELTSRVEELLAVLNYIAKDLSEVSAKLKAAAQEVTRLQPAEGKSDGEKAEKTLRSEDVIAAFPEDLQKLLKFEDKGSFIMIKPSGFLGSDNFARIADIVRNRFNGEYISAGRDSHFRVPKS